MVGNAKTIRNIFYTIKSTVFFFKNNVNNCVTIRKTILCNQTLQKCSHHQSTKCQKTSHPNASLPNITKTDK